MGSQDSSIRFRKTYLLGLGENLITRIGETLVANYTTKISGGERESTTAREQSRRRCAASIFHN